MFNILDLAIWWSTQMQVDKMATDARQRELGNAETAKKAWTC